MAFEPIYDEKELIGRVAAGDEQAFTTIFNAYHNQLGEFVYLLTRSSVMTEEIIQDVFVKVWMNRQTLTEIEKFHAWLFILTRNYTLNCIRKAANSQKKERQHGLFVLHTQPEAEPTPSSEPDYLSLLDRAVAQLSPQQQKVYYLSRHKGLKYTEIAQQMGLSKETVKKYLQWATHSIVEFMREHAAVLAVLTVLSKKV